MLASNSPRATRNVFGLGRVLVLDGDERASLAVVRALVRAGYVVAVGSRRRWSIAGASVGAAPEFIGEDPLRAPLEYVRAVAAIVERTRPTVIIPVTDASADAILEHRDLLPGDVRLPFCSREIYRAASDKILVHRIATELGIGVGSSAVIDEPVAGRMLDDGLFPGVVKPHRSVVGGESRIKTGVKFVANREEAERVLEALPPQAFPVLVQPRVHGPGEGVFIARWGGRTLARFAHRRLREKPPAGGVSVYRESIEMDPAVLEACEALLDRLGWQGVAMIEGKRDLTTGRWVVMEINGRFWGSLQLAIDAGVDFPALLVRAVLGGAPEPVPEWEPGVRLRWEWGDIDHLLIRMRRSREALSLPADAPSRLSALLRFLAHRPGRDRLEVFRWRDPLPFVVESLKWLGISQ